MASQQNGYSNAAAEEIGENDPKTYILLKSIDN
jgi:hypothetical protein